jgi:precorrin-6B methylase 2
MPKMMEIYKDFSVNYDELLSFEDYQNNLTKILLEKIDWQDKVVYEAGIGTGRLTKIYIDKSKHCYGFDREDHMMKKCKINLKNYLDKITLSNCENIELKKIQEPVDIFIEGWSIVDPIVKTINQLS